MPASLKSNLNARNLQQHFDTAVLDALNDTGKYVQNRAAKYPKQSARSTYRRTGTLGRNITTDKAAKSGNRYHVTVGTIIPYAPDVEAGTGIFGPKGSPIKPKSAKVLAWLATRGSLKNTGYSGGKLVASGLRKSGGRLKRSRSKDSMMVFARSVKGFQGWHFMEKAITSPETKQYITARLKNLAKQIQASFG